MAIVAVEDEPWRVAVSIAGGPLATIDPEALQGVARQRETPRRETADALDNAAELARAITRAVAWAAGR